MNSDLFVDLAAPFPSELIDWRLGSTSADKTKGRALAYIDARTVMDRLDLVCGPMGWQRRYCPVNGKATICEIGLWSGEAWIWKADGAGNTDIEAEKGALSDSFKRAGVNWGIGRYLYKLPAPWVAIEPFGRSFKIAEHELKKLNEIHETEAAKHGKALVWGHRSAINIHRAWTKLIDESVADSYAAQDFLKRYKPEMALFPVGARKATEEQLSRIGANTQEAA